MPKTAARSAAVFEISAKNLRGGRKNAPPPSTARVNGHKPKLSDGVSDCLYTSLIDSLVFNCYIVFNSVVSALVGMLSA